MRYSLEQLEIFKQVAQLGSFSAAARHLNKAQSTVSTAIANLEIDLGLLLFNRDTKYPVLTEQGAEILKSVELVLAQSLALDNHAQLLSMVEQSHMNIAVEVPYSTILEPLKDFASSFPNIELSFRSSEKGKVIDALLKEEIQLSVSFAQSSYPSGIEFRQLGKLILTHVVHHKHPLATKKHVDFLELRTFRRLSLSAHKNQLPSTEYLNAAHTWEGENFLAILTLVKAQLGWATLPRQMILEEIHKGELVELSLIAYPHTDWVVGVDLIWAQQGTKGRATEWLKNRLLNHKVKEYDASGNSTTL